VPISIQLKLCLYFVPILRYSASKNVVTLILKMAPFDRPNDFLLVRQL